MKDELLSTISSLDREIHDHVVDEDTQKNTPLDTCLKWSPFVLLLVYSGCGFKTKNNYKRQILQMLAGEIMLNAAIRPLKKSINRIRPNGELKSFPSAHTATGFLASHIMCQELKEHHPALKHRGYALSLVTGWLRLYHNKHWFSDVVGGAIMGALVGKVSSRLLNNLTEK